MSGFERGRPAEKSGGRTLRLVDERQVAALVVELVGQLLYRGKYGLHQRYGRHSRSAQTRGSRESAAVKSKPPAAGILTGRFDPDQTGVQSNAASYQYQAPERRN